MIPTEGNPPDPQKNLKRKRTSSGSESTRRIHRFTTSEDVAADALADSRPPLRYGFIVAMEDEYWGRQLVRQHVRIQCILARWFDRNYRRGRSFGAVDSNAIESQMCHIEMILNPEIVRDMDQFLQDVPDIGGRGHLPHMHEGNWIAVWLTPDNGIPVTIYLPAPGSDDPATIGTEPNATSGFAIVQRLNPMKLRELRWYSDEYGV